MRILAFSDLHGNMKSFELIKNRSKSSDLVICAGDISIMEKNLTFLLTQLNSLNKPTLLIHGNHEDERGLKDKCNIHENIIFLHKAIHTIEKYIFLGYGGGGFAQEDHEFTKLANHFFKKHIQDEKKIILITHAPPYKSKIDLVGGEHRGNKSIRKFIDEIKPQVVISGHLHENSGKSEKMGRTLIMSPGKEGMIINL